MSEFNHSWQASVFEYAIGHAIRNASAFTIFFGLGYLNVGIHLYSSISALSGSPCKISGKFSKIFGFESERKKSNWELSDEMLVILLFCTEIWRVVKVGIIELLRHFETFMLDYPPV